MAGVATTSHACARAGSWAATRLSLAMSAMRAVALHHDIGAAWNRPEVDECGRSHEPFLDRDEQVSAAAERNRARLGQLFHGVFERCRRAVFEWMRHAVKRKRDPKVPPWCPA